MEDGDARREPVQVNITKIILFISSLFFSLGLLLIVTTVMDWFYNSSLYDSLQFIKFTSLDALVVCLLLLIIAILFPSNDQLNLSTVLKKRAVSPSKKLIIILFRIETLILLFLGIYFLQELVGFDLLAAGLLFIAAITVLFQTSYSRVHPTVNFIQSIKLRILNLIDNNIVSDRKLMNITGSFFSQLFPSVENIFILLVFLLLVNLLDGIIISVLGGALLSIMTFNYFDSLSSRGNYFRKYTNVILSLIAVYMFYEIFLK